MKIKNDHAFACIQIDGAYIATLVALVNACRLQGVNVNTVHSYQNGFRVTFEDFSGDAICHDGSYGSPYYHRYFDEDKYQNDFNNEAMWETIGFPWDYGDVSIHTSEELAYYLKCFKDGVAAWETYEEV